MIESPDFLKSITSDQPLEDILIEEFDEMMVLFTVMLKDKFYDIKRIKGNTLFYTILLDSKEDAIRVHNYLNDMCTVTRFGKSFSIKSEQSSNEVQIHILKE